MKFNFIIFFLLSFILLQSMVIVELEFKGNQIFSTDEIKAVMISYQGMEYDQQTILEDASRIAELYQRKGYYLAKVMIPEVIPLSQTEIRAIITIEEGNDLTIGKVDFTGNNYITTEKLLTDIKAQILFLRDLPGYRRELVDYYNENSFYFAQVEIENITLNQQGSVDLGLKISEGAYCRFKHSLIRGNLVTRNKTILQLGRLYNRENLTPLQIKQAERNLLARPYIKSCQIIPLNSSTLLYDIEEGNMTAFSGLIGYDNGRDSEGRFTGYIDVNFENLWGTDRSVGFFWENRQEQHSAIELNYHESGWDYPLGADISLYREEMDSTWIEVSYELEFYWFDLFNRAGIYLERQNVYAGSQRPVIIDETEFDKTGVFWNYTTLDHPRNPQSGYAYSLKYYYIWSRTLVQHSGRQAAEMQYQKIFPLTGRWVFCSKINFNVIENHGLTKFDKFEAGGANSIRGFLEKQFSGYRAGWLNLEFRYILNKEARLSLNADLGNIENMKTGNETIYSIGCGLRTTTPIGQLSLDFAVPNDRNGFKNPLEGILHFGLETRF